MDRVQGFWDSCGPKYCLSPKFGKHLETRQEKYVCACLSTKGAERNGLTVTRAGSVRNVARALLLWLFALENGERIELEMSV